MRVRRCAAIVALPVAAVMLVAGCSSSGSGGSGNANGAITIDDVQPQNPLIPSNTNEDGGHRVVEAVFSHLVNFNVDTAKPEMNTAESITTADAKSYDIKLKPGWNFRTARPRTRRATSTRGTGRPTPRMAHSTPAFSPRSRATAR